LLVFWIGKLGGKLATLGSELAIFGNGSHGMWGRRRSMPPFVTGHGTPSLCQMTYQESGKLR
jgi:hypothetical protein